MIPISDVELRDLGLRYMTIFLAIKSFRFKIEETRALKLIQNDFRDPEDVFLGRKAFQKIL